MSERWSARHLWGLPLASMTVPLLLLAAVAWHDHRETFAQAQRHVERNAAVLYEHTLRAFETFAYVHDEIDNHIAGLSWDQIAASEDIKQHLRRAEEAFPQIGSLWLIDPDGRMRSSSVDRAIQGLDLSDRDYFRALKSGAERYVSQTNIGRVSGVPVFSVTRRRSAPQGTFDGVISVAVHMPDFQEVFSRAAAVPADAVSLVREDGTILGRYPDGKLIRLTPESGFMQAIARSPQGGSFRTVSQGDGVERLFEYRKLGSAPVYINYGRSVDAVRAEWRSHVLFYALFAVPSALLLGLVSWLVIRKERSEREARARAAAETVRRQRAEELLQKIQRLEMLGQIAGGIAHDFNNLLMVITSNLYLAQSRAGENSAAPFIDTAMQAAYRGGQLTQQLLTFARQQTLKPEVVDANDALGAMVDGMLKRSLRGDIAVETDLAPDVWPVEVDRAQMELAVLNLAVNARDAMPGGGTLEVRTRNVTFDGGAKAPDGLRGEFVALSLTDTGCGIAPEVCERVFDPFFTTKDVGKGTGLGLSQVYGFATQSGGTVTVDSTVGRGTTFTLYLPRTGNAPAHRASVAPVKLPEGKGRAILLVEDSPEIGRTTTTLLEGMDYSVTLADNAHKALDVLSNGRRFDLVFSDIVMPGTMNGLDLGRAVRQRFPDLPVLLTTGYSNAASTAAAEGFRLLQKPYRPEMLSEALRDLMSVRA
ncbi:MAG TPA: ATP-binding protein [Azospirillum sp.]